MLTVGVISADAVPEVGMSGSIKVPANKYIVAVYGYIGESIDQNNLPPPDFCSVGEAPENNPNGTVYGSEWVFTEQQMARMTFSLNGVNTLDQFKSKAVYVTFLIETTSVFNMKAYFKEEVSEGVWEKSDGTDTLGDNAVDVVLNTASISASGSSSTTQTFISLKFSPLKFVETATSEKYDFSYILNIEEDIPDDV